MFEASCIPKPRLSVSETWLPLSIILVTLIVLGLLSSMLMQLKILVSGSFYPGVERERIQYLHAKLLKKRSKQPLGEAERKLSLYFKKVRSRGKYASNEANAVSERQMIVDFKAFYNFTSGGQLQYDWRNLLNQVFCSWLLGRSFVLATMEQWLIFTFLHQR